ncbi:PrpF domain-containing protein [Acerihabitans sp. KWT182]|uniref:PrpF domain-containing protein n=1 Tax=Acerihabitans sp. KWT182 TaxID=3157919 RepID=A0AAU7QBT7_9GAMM
MHPEMKMIKCTIVRGGTSKGVFIMKNDLPSDPDKRDAVIRAIYGSPDIRQIDGLGGADVLTSKLAIISQSTRKDADVDYTFAQVGIDTELVNYNGSCGNIASAVGAFAIDEGIVAAKDPLTMVRVHLTNSDTVLTQEVPVLDGKARVIGDYSIDGCPGTGARITLDWAAVVAQKPDCILPTKNVIDSVTVDGKNYNVTITGIGNFVIFIHASSLNMSGIESPSDIAGNNKLMILLERIRGEISVRLGMVDSPEEAARVTPYQPFVAIIAEPESYSTLNGTEVRGQDIDLTSRLVFMQKVHKTYPISAATGIGAAARIPGTIVWDILKKEIKMICVS